MAELFDTDPANRTPQDGEAIWMGASRVRDLKGKLQTMLSKVFDGSYNFLTNAIPGSALTAQSVKSGQLLDNTVGGAAQSDLIQARHLANGILTLDQIDTTSANKLFGDGFKTTGKTITPLPDGKTLDLATQLGQSELSLLVKNAGIGFTEISQGVARIWVGSYLGNDPSAHSNASAPNGTHLNFITMNCTQYGRGGVGQVNTLQPDFILMTRDGYSDTFIAFRAEADGNGFSNVHPLYNSGQTTTGTFLGTVYWGVGGVGFSNTSSTNFNGWSGSGLSYAQIRHYMVALGF